jgi:tetratricopeptide (TPR) repeat protein
VKLMTPALTVLVCALSLRLFFVQEVLLQQSLLYSDLNAAPKAGFLTGDSGAYMDLAKDFFHGYFGVDARSNSLLRPPGYPGFCAPFYSLSLAPDGILIAQALLGSLVPVVTFLLAWMLTSSILLAGFAGLLSAVSPSGIGVSGLIMSDNLFAVLFAAGLYLLYLGTIGSRPAWIISAGLLFSCGLIVKPILLFWPALVILIYFLLCRGENKPANWKALVIAVAIQLLILGLWCTRNYVYENVFLPSSVSTNNLHDFLRPRVEEWVKAGGLPNNQSVRRNRDETRALIDHQFSHRPSKEKLDLLNSRSIEVFRAHPLVTLQVLLQDIKENALSGWDYFHRQLPLGNMQVKRLTEAARLESSFKEKTLIATGVAFSFLLLTLCVRPTAARRRVVIHLLILMLILGYFALFSGTTFWAGSRIMYPVEFVMLLLLVMALQTVGSVSRKALERARLIPDAASRTVGLLNRYGPWVMLALTLGVGVYGTSLILEKDAATYSNFGKALASRGAIEESIPYFEKAVQLIPQNPQAKANLAQAYILLEKYGRAIPLLRDAQRAKPGDADSNYLLGLALANTGNLQEGLKYVQEALRLNPNHGDARHTHNMLVNKTDSKPSPSSAP